MTESVLDFALPLPGNGDLTKGAGTHRDWQRSLAFVDFSPMPDSQDHDLRPLKIEDHTIVTDAKPIRSRFRLFEWFCVDERVPFVSLKRFADALVQGCIERIKVLDRAVGLDQPVCHRPNTSA